MLGWEGGSFHLILWKARYKASGIESKNTCYQYLCGSQSGTSFGHQRTQPALTPVSAVDRVQFQSLNDVSYGHGLQLITIAGQYQNMAVSQLLLREKEPELLLGVHQVLSVSTVHNKYQGLRVFVERPPYLMLQNVEQVCR